MKKQIVGLLLALFLLAGLLPTTVFAAEGDVTYLYYDANDANWQTGTKAASEYAVVTSGNTSWGTAGTTTWYVATDDIAISSRVTVSGDVHLILADNCTLTISGGIQVTGSNALTIYGQGNGTGKLNAYAASGSHFAGIGGNVYTTGESWTPVAGTITINGGNITATGDGNGSGIGGGSGGGYDAITINGGSVIAQSGNGRLSSGIGASGGEATSATITISGGTVVATGTACGIDASVMGTISTGNDGHAVIFASGDDQALNLKQGNDSDSWSGVIFEGNSGKVYGASVTPSVNFTIPAGKTLTIDSGKTLTIPAGVKLTIEDGGTLTNNGTIINFGTIIGTVSGNRPVNVVSAKYLDEKGDEKTYTSAIEVTNSDTSWGTAGTTT